MTGPMRWPEALNHEASPSLRKVAEEDFMARTILSLLVPPFAVCRYGCAGCCAAPIGVFWVTGIVALIYGYAGGPLGLDGISWGTVGLGVILWLIASVWAFLTIRAVDKDQCDRKSSPLCNRIIPRSDESDPMDEVRRAR